MRNGLWAIGLWAACGGLCGFGARADVLFVDADAAGANSGTSWADAFTDLESALSAAGPGDAVWVAEGEYFPSVGRNGIGEDSAEPKDAVFLLPPGVSLHGGFAGYEDSLDERAGSAAGTVLSGAIGGAGPEDNARTVVLYLQQPWTPNERGWVDRVRITGADGTGDPRNGAGLRALGFSNAQVFAPALLDITGCVIEGNTAGGQGGGVFLDLWQGRMEDCRITDNRSSQYGGGVDLIAPVAPSAIVGCVFEGNANGATGVAGTPGGGLRVSSPAQSGALVIERCRFVGNRAGGGGGGLAYLVTSTASPGVPEFVVRDSLFVGNEAGQTGGAMDLRVFRPPGTAAFRIERCTVADNVSGSDGGGAGVHAARSALTVRNSVVWGNLGPEGAAAQIGLGAASSAEVGYSCVEGGFAGAGNITADPGFVADGSYRLTPGSACVDAGDSGPDAPATDLGGRARLVNAVRADTGLGCPVIDLGAFELGESCVGDWNADCATDFVDLARYLGDWGAQAGAADLDADGAWTFFDVSVFVGALLGGC